MVNEETLGTLLLDFALLTIALLLATTAELDALLLKVAALLEIAGVLDLGVDEAIDDGADEEIAIEVAVDDVLPLHNIPFTLGAPAVPFA